LDKKTARRVDESVPALRAITVVLVTGASLARTLRYLLGYSVKT